ncbi:hypothetical protein C8R44DRAFT_896520 [Mycena epipterygia]|nr:hypothetical protein C8R44DRAFT_896520 [Mycena epipterygia]
MLARSCTQRYLRRRDHACAGTVHVVLHSPIVLCISVSCVAFSYPSSHPPRARVSASSSGTVSLARPTAREFDYTKEAFEAYRAFGTLSSSRLPLSLGLALRLSECMPDIFSAPASSTLISSHTRSTSTSAHQPASLPSPFTPPSCRLCRWSSLASMRLPVPHSFRPSHSPTLNSLLLPAHTARPICHPVIPAARPSRFSPHLATCHIRPRFLHSSLTLSATHALRDTSPRHRASYLPLAAYPHNSSPKATNTHPFTASTTHVAQQLSEEARAVRHHFRPRGHEHSPIRARGADAGRWSSTMRARYRSTYTETATAFPVPLTQARAKLAEGIDLRTAVSIATAFNAPRIE